MAKTTAKRQPAKIASFSPEETASICAAIYPLAGPLMGTTLYLLDAAWEREGPYWYLRLYIERLKDKLDLAVSLEECASLSRALDPILEEAHSQGKLPIPSACAYALEVSSPGLFRQLKSDRELTFYQGSSVLVQALARPTDPESNDRLLGTLGVVHPKEGGLVTEVILESGEIRLIDLTQFAITLSPALINLNSTPLPLDEVASEKP